MSYKVKQANIFGRIGSGIGQGLAEQLPKEIERSRLASGLQQLESQKNMTPFQQFSRLAAIPGITPQMIQSGSELLRQQGVSEGLNRVNQQNAMPQNQPSPLQQYENVPQNTSKAGITTSEPVRATIENYIPKTRAQILQTAAQMQKENPQLYPTPQDAINGAIQEDESNLRVSQAEQRQRDAQNDVLKNLESRLSNQAQNLGAQVPGNVFEKIRQKAIENVRNGDTEDVAAQKAGEELDKISRQYEALKTVGDAGYMIRDKADIKRNLRQIREDFKARNDLENLADKYISENGLSPRKAYYLAYPSYEIKPLNNELSKLPEVESERKRLSRTLPFGKIEEQIAKDSDKIYEKLANAMGKEGSLLSIAEELRSRGYDSEAWLDYVGKNRNSLQLTERQARELHKPRNAFPTLNDNWLFFSSGLDKLVEQE